MDAREFDDLMIRVAWLYHQRGWTQEQIAHHFRVSRATVARVLQRAIRDELVKICFAAEPEHRMLLEEGLCQRYSLEEAILVPSTVDSPARQTALAKATAAYLERSLEDGTVVGLGTSRTLHEMTDIYSPSRKLPNCVFVEMLGGITDEDPRFDIYNVSWKLGLFLAAGNALGGWWAARLSVRGGEKIIRYVLIVAILIMSLKLLGVF